MCFSCLSLLIQIYGRLFNPPNFVLNILSFVYKPSKEYTNIRKIIQSTNQGLSRRHAAVGLGRLIGEDII